MESSKSYLTPRRGRSKNNNAGAAAAVATSTPPNNASDASLVDEGERGGEVRVGDEYQAETPPFIPLTQRRPEQCPERELLMWSPAPLSVSAKLDGYVQMAKERYGYSADQALGLVFWHKYDVDAAVQDLSRFHPFPDEWSEEDKVLFERAFQFHGKSFSRIRQMLPEKSIAQLVRYYYGWKNARTRNSLMDSKVRRLHDFREEQDAYGEEADIDVAEVAEVEDEPKPRCFNCGIPCNVTHATPEGELCGTCLHDYCFDGQVRPTTAPDPGTAGKDPGAAGKTGARSKCKRSTFRNSNRPPEGLYINHDDLLKFSTGGTVSKGDANLKDLDREIAACKRTAQINKQQLSVLQSKTKANSVDAFRIPDLQREITSKWTGDEQLLGIQGIRKFGKNFKAIAEIIGTKTESHVSGFYKNFRRRYNLDAALIEYEAGRVEEITLDSDPDTPTKDPDNVGDCVSNPDSPSAE